MVSLVTTGSDLISIWNDRFNFYLKKKAHDTAFAVFSVIDQSTPRYLSSIKSFIILKLLEGDNCTFISS